MDNDTAAQAKRLQLLAIDPGEVAYAILTLEARVKQQQIEINALIAHSVALH